MAVYTIPILWVSKCLSSSCRVGQQPRDLMTVSRSCAFILPLRFWSYSEKHSLYSEGRQKRITIHRKRSMRTFENQINFENYTFFVWNASGWQIKTFCLIRIGCSLAKYLFNPKWRICSGIHWDNLFRLQHYHQQQVDGGIKARRYDTFKISLHCCNVFVSTVHHLSCIYSNI